MQIYIKEVDEIYSSKTKKYFKEVISSYENGNYRSAIVMLYSVVACDILFKLQELVDKYDDSGAETILNNLRKNAKDANKSQWENKLFEDVCHKTELIDEITYEQLTQLKKYRNWSAHPILNDNFELIEPTKEITIAFILMMLNKILIKPSIFIKNVFDLLTEDLEENREIYIQNEDRLEQYLNNKYFTRMPLLMKKKVFKSLWKITFNKSSDDTCNKNRIINRKALIVLVNIAKNEIFDFIKEDNSIFPLSIDEMCILHMIIFLTVFPEFYNILEESAKDKINKVIFDNVNAKGLSWFIKGDLRKHLELIKEECFDLDKESVEYISKYYANNGLESELIDVWIFIFLQSSHFSTADKRYYKYINPYLQKMTQKQLTQLIDGINKNSQIYGRRGHEKTCTEIYEVAKVKLKKDFCFSNYENFFIAQDDKISEEVSTPEIEEDDIPY